MTPLPGLALAKTLPGATGWLSLYACLGEMRLVGMEREGSLEGRTAPFPPCELDDLRTQ